MYRGQLWLNVVINKLARGIGRLPLKTYALGADGERLRQRDGWLSGSLARPMPGKPPFAWKQAIVGNICVYGNAVVVKVRPGPGKPPTELWTSSFRYWEVVPGRSAPVDAYVFHGAAGQRLAFAPEDVLHFKWWGTGNDLVAFSPMEPLRRTLMIEDAAQRLTAASYDNGARPSGVLVTDQQLKPDTAKRLQEQTASLHGLEQSLLKVPPVKQQVVCRPTGVSPCEVGKLARCREFGSEGLVVQFDDGRCDARRLHYVPREEFEQLLHYGHVFRRRCGEVPVEERCAQGSVGGEYSEQLGLPGCSGTCGDEPELAAVLPNCDEEVSRFQRGVFRIVEMPLGGAIRDARSCVVPR